MGVSFSVYIYLLIMKMNELTRAFATRPVFGGPPQRILDSEGVGDLARGRKVVANGWLRQAAIAGVIQAGE